MDPVGFIKSNRPKVSFLDEVLPFVQQKAQETVQTLQRGASDFASDLQGAISPVKGKFDITQKFGNYNPSLYSGITQGSRHLGLDLATPMGTDVYAPATGSVSYGKDKNWGNYADVTLGDGTTVRFSHLSQTGKNQAVRAGQVIAKTGNSGNSTGAHLDISVKKNGQYIDPAKTGLVPQGGGGEWDPQKIKSSLGNIADTVKQKFKEFLPHKETYKFYADNYQPKEAPVPTASPAPTQIPEINPEVLKSMIQVYGNTNSPLLEYVGEIAKKANGYPFWQNNPELLALLPHLETSSGKNVTRPNNWTNWGIANPANNEIFATMTPLEVFERMLSGIAERMPQYEQFRTGTALSDDQLQAFAKIYEPANDSYGPNLIAGRKFIRQTLNK